MCMCMYMYMYIYICMYVHVYTYRWVMPMRLGDATPPDAKELWNEAGIHIGMHIDSIHTCIRMHTVSTPTQRSSRTKQARDSPLLHFLPLTAHHSPLTTHHSTLTIQHSTLNTQHSTLSTQHIPLRTQHIPLWNEAGKRPYIGA